MQRSAQDLALVITLCAIGLSLQGCAQNRLLYAVEQKFNAFVQTSQTGGDTSSKDTESVVVAWNRGFVRRGRYDEDGLPHPTHAKPEGMSLLQDGNSAVSHDAKLTRKVKDWGVMMQREDDKEQHELNEAYNQMLYLNDPDDVSKAMQLAWLKMQKEDRDFTRAMKKETTADHSRHGHRGRIMLNQLSSRGTQRKRMNMLNQHYHLSTASSALVSHLPARSHADKTTPPAPKALLGPEVLDDEAPAATVDLSTAELADF